MGRASASAAEQAASDLGSRLRRRRQAVGLTMQAVADHAGLTAGFISQVERNLAAPSLTSLTSIAEALGAHITDFLDPPRNKDLTSREDSRELYALPGAPVSYERLSTTFAGSTLTAVLQHEPPGRRAEPMRHRGEELYYVLRGEITVYVDGTETVLRKGDSIHFASTRRHYTWNHTDRETTILVCSTMNVFEDPIPDGGDPGRPNPDRQR
jgi:transcriptional regulator with XRE-family HTH domain